MIHEERHKNIVTQLGGLTGSKIGRSIGKRILRLMYILRLAFWKARLKKMGDVKNIGKYVVMHHPECITVGDNSSISDLVHIRGGGIVEIGNDTMLAACVSIISESDEKDVECYQKSLGRNKVSIGNNVWIGTGAIILPGVTIGDGAIVGAAAVVNTDVAPKSRVVGIPAKPQSI
jgi:acetyltransferase-like isoleucine patch superfamily enzyme